MGKRAARMIGAALVAPLGGCFHTLNVSVIEAARAEQPYDYIVHVRNTFDYGYNPEVSEDRVRLARQVVKPYCGNSRVLGEHTISTEIPGITSSRPDYVVYIKCERR